MRTKAKKTKPDDAPTGQTIGVPMQAHDLAALRRYQDDQGKATMVPPKKGPAALAIYRAGLRALGYEVAP